MKRYIVTLNEAERTWLEAMTRQRKADSQVVDRHFNLLAHGLQKPCCQMVNSRQVS